MKYTFNEATVCLFLLLVLFSAVTLELYNKVHQTGSHSS